ncbi:hypothetical protein [Deinococcus sp. RL]|uniref:hypothetical protein n=1 Tax=Deinococcus sp. RL TaxID=1489678 RepID=UPI001267B02E|nr:hypothetical protein [Deinococcus sp. RL]
MTSQHDTQPAGGKFPLAGADNWLLCPVCGFNHAHIVGGGVMPHGTGERWRGPHTFASALMTFEGECGHRWEIVARFSKGQVELTVDVLDGGA